MNLDHDQRLASYNERPLGCGCGVNAASITRRSLARSPSSCEARMPQATNCVPAHAVLVAAEKARPSSVQAGPAIISASTRFRPVTPTRRARGISAACTKRVIGSEVVTMARVRNLHRLDLYCPEYMTNVTILIDQNHHSGQPHLVAHYEMGGLKGQMQFAAAIPAHWGDDDLVELIFLPLEKRENRSYPTWEVPTRDHGSATLFKFWKRERAP